MNPTDWKHYFYGLAGDNSTLGCDYAGIVEEVGKDVTKSFKKGDKIFGVAHGGNANYAANQNDGIFAEYAVVKGDLQMHIPSNLTPAAASTIALGASTVAQSCFQSALKLNLPSNPADGSEYVLVYGGSTATGSLALQYLKLAGYKVITTCSPKHFDWMKKHDVTPFDYSSPTVGADIRKFTDNKLKYAFDCISLPDSTKICSEALTSESGAKYGALLPVDFPRKDVSSVTTIMYTIFDEDFEMMGNKFPRSTEDFEFCKSFFGLTEKLVAEGKLEAHPVEERSDGLDGVLKGMDEMRQNGVSGVKLVYAL